MWPASEMYGAYSHRTLHPVTDASCKCTPCVAVRGGRLHLFCCLMARPYTMPCLTLFGTNTKLGHAFSHFVFGYSRIHRSPFSNEYAPKRKYFSACLRPWPLPFYIRPYMLSLLFPVMARAFYMQIQIRLQFKSLGEVQRGYGGASIGGRIALVARDILRSFFGPAGHEEVQFSAPLPHVLLNDSG